MKKTAERLKYILLLFLLVFGGAETERMADYIHLVVLPTLIMLIALLIFHHLAQKKHSPKTALEIARMMDRKGRRKLLKSRINLKLPKPRSPRNS